MKQHILTYGDNRSPILAAFQTLFVGDRISMVSRKYRVGFCKLEGILWPLGTVIKPCGGAPYTPVTLPRSNDVSVTCAKLRESDW